jgi:hypothetical protein
MLLADAAVPIHFGYDSCVRGRCDEYASDHVLHTICNSGLDHVSGRVSFYSEMNR